MNGTMIRGRTKQVRGECRKRWCRLTGDTLGQLSGRMLKFSGGLQVRYGRMRQMVGL